MISTLEDVLTTCTTALTDIVSSEAVILYGSFSYQDITKSTQEFVELDGEKGVLDKKPDFIVIVEDIETALTNLDSAYEWGKRDTLLRLNRKTPFYFNINTLEESTIPLQEGSAQTTIPYKIGVIGIDQLEGEIYHNLYLPSRLSKHVNLVVSTEKGERTIGEYIGNVQEFFAQMALGLLPNEFTGEEFAHTYLKATYLTELYRVFDLVKRKHLKILESETFDFETRTVVPMRQPLGNMFANLLSVSVSTLEESDFYDTQFNTSDNKRPSPADFLRYNMASLQATWKNRTTNSIAGGNNLKYVLRKFRL